MCYSLPAGQAAAAAAALRLGSYLNQVLLWVSRVRYHRTADRNKTLTQLNKLTSNCFLFLFVAAACDVPVAGVLAGVRLSNHSVPHAILTHFDSYPTAAQPTFPRTSPKPKLKIIASAGR